MQTADHGERIGVCCTREEECGGEARDGDTEADGHLLRGAGNGTCVAGFDLRGVSVGEGVHAGVLQRRERSVTECQGHDDPDWCAKPDGGEDHHENSDDDGV